MKKSITGAVALLAGAFVAHSQGQVSFADFYSSGNYVNVEYLGQPVGGTATHTGTPNDIHAGSDWTVQLYGVAGFNQPLGALVPAILDGTVSTPVTATLAGGGTAGTYLGQWYSTEIGDISGTTFANQPATVAVAAWYNNGGTITSYAAAQAFGYIYAFSATGNVTTGGPLPGGGGADVAAPLPQLGNGIIDIGVPEPSAVALCVIGASAFLVRFLRK